MTMTRGQDHDPREELQGETMSKEQDAAFFRNFTLVLVALTAFGFFAAYMGRHLATSANQGAATATAATETTHE
jgi:hypothetical protein